MPNLTQFMVSAIIPTHNSSLTIGRCLASIFSQTFRDIEVIVVDRYSTDSTVEISRRLGSTVTLSAASRSEARGIGSRLAKGEYILSLDSDMELTPRVVEACVGKSQGGHDAIVIPEISVGQGYWARCKALERACYVGDELIEAPRFFTREILQSVGGYDRQLEFGEDWDLKERVRAAGYRIGRVNAPIIHHEGTLSLLRTVRKKWRYGKSLHLYRRKQPNIATRQLWLIRPAYIRNWKALMADPLHASGMLFMKGCEFAAMRLGAASANKSDIP